MISVTLWGAWFGGLHVAQTLRITPLKTCWVVVPVYVTIDNKQWMIVVKPFFCVITFTVRVGLLTEQVSLRIIIC